VFFGWGCWVWGGGGGGGGGVDFPHPSRPALGPTHPPPQWVRGLISRVKWPGCGVDHPPPYSVKVKERVKLYLSSSSEPSWRVVG